MTELYLFAFAAGCWFAAVFFRDLLAAGKIIARRLFPLIILAGAGNLSAASIVTPALLDRLAIVESGGVKPGTLAIGDGGRARGPYQMKREAWIDAGKILGDKTGWIEGTKDPVIARKFAATYLAELESRLTAATRKAPTAETLYCAYNLGSMGFRRRGFSLKRCPIATQLAARKLASRQTTN